MFKKVILWLKSLVATREKAHVHKWEEVPWDKSLGKSVEPIFEGSMAARFKELHKCSCGETKIESNTALI